MSLWLAIACQSLLVLIASMCLLRLCKALRGKRGALSQRLNLDDLQILAVVALSGTFSAYTAPGWFNLVFAFSLFFFGVLVWIDALLFVQYRIEVNRQTLMWFLTGSKGLAKGVPHLFSLLRKSPWGAIIPFIWCGLVVVWFSQMPMLHLGYLTLGCLLLAVLVLVPAKHGVPMVLTFALLALGLSSLEHVDWQFIAAVVFFCCTAMLLLLTLLRRLFHSQHEFLTTPTLLKNILADDRFDANDHIAIRPEHQSHVAPPMTTQEKSPLHGRCAGANVILITFESLGAYVQPYTQQEAYSRLAERLKDKGWVSQQHFCLCPNTTVSTNQIYSGAYSNNPYNKKDSLYPGESPQHIQRLKAAGYRTLFLDSADIGLYDYHKLLKRIGFDHVWGTNDIPANGLKADYRLWNMVDTVAETVRDTPFFLHIINDQTHMPYEVVDSRRFNRHSGNGAKSVYLNAVEEVDYILDTFLRRLEDKLDLSNTLLVFTGDHGESFGEFGYSFHSNSVIKPQVQVPFMMYHPELEPREVAHSCHFDLFPTFFDLLGIEYDYPCIGKSLALESRDFAYFFHSATLKGNSPANFGFMLDGEMVWMDRLFNRASVISDNNCRLVKGSSEVNYIGALLKEMLKKRYIMQ